jgi:hypothetical protein
MGLQEPLVQRRVKGDDEDEEPRPHPKPKRATREILVFEEEATALDESNNKLDDPVPSQSSSSFKTELYIELATQSRNHRQIIFLYL